MVGKYTLLDCCEIPSFYRPFYYNAALLLFPKNFGINNNTHAYKFIENIETAGKTTKNDNKECHGRLFYSITNGATMEREVELISNKDGSSNGTVFRNTLDSVNFDLNKGEYNLTIKHPFRNYDEIDGPEFRPRNNNEEYKLMELNQNDPSKVSLITKKIVYGITEPFTVEEEGKKVYRDGISIGIRNEKNDYSVEVETKACSTNEVFYMNDNLIRINENGPIRDSFDNNIFPMEKGKDYIQIIDAKNKEEEETNMGIDATKRMDVMLKTTEYAPEGANDLAKVVSGSYSNVGFYSNIEYDKESNKYKVEGMKDPRVRYFELMIDENEVANLLKSIYDFQIYKITGDGFPNVRFNGINTNDYFLGNKNKEYRGWKSIHTVLKRLIQGDSKNYCVELSGREYGDGSGESHGVIDITGTLMESFESGDYVTRNNSVAYKRPIVVGVCDTYTGLSGSEYLEERGGGERKGVQSIIKPHSTKFSIIKFYKLYKDENEV